MKKLTLLFLLSSFSVSAQFDPSDFEGFWRGTWFNNTFQSTDSAFITIDVDETNSSLEMILDLDGNVFGGTDPDPATMTGTYDDNGFSVSGNSSTYGDMFFTGTADGNITGRLPNVPNPNIDSTTLEGTYNQDSIYMTYLVYAGGNAFANGVINVKKDPSTGIDKLPFVVNNFYLFQNYPNPFNPTTTIKFALPKESFIKLEIFNALGEKVSTLVSETLSPGTYEYEWNAEGLPSGVYFSKLEAVEFISTKKMLMIK